MSDKGILIQVVAPIGLGKTSLVHILAEHLHGKQFLEQVDDVPLLKEFYAGGSESRQQLSFPLQVFFLNFRFKQLREGLSLQSKGINTIYDSCLLSDSLMMKNLHDTAGVSSTLYNLYLDLLQNMITSVGSSFNGSSPDLYIYLKGPFELMLEHIQHRGRAMEDITKDPELVDYYHSVWELFNNWAKSYSQSPVLNVDMSKYDYVNNEEDKNFVLNMVNDKLVSLGLLTPTKRDELSEKREVRKVEQNA